MGGEWYKSPIEKEEESTRGRVREKQELKVELATRKTFSEPSGI